MKRSVTLISLVALMGLASCGTERNLNPMTGNSESEVMLGHFSSRAEVQEGKVYSVTSRTLNVRPGDGSEHRPLGYLSRYDQVRVISNLETLNSSYVEIEIVKTWNNIKKADRYFVSYKYLAEKVDDHKEFKGEYFVVQNVATERARVYKRGCDSGACDHELVLEAQVAMGQDKNGERTWVGSYRITDWVKFYQDGKKHYPSWYDARYPKLPKPGKGFNTWLRKKYMPEVKDEKIGVMRGAFGWYAASSDHDITTNGLTEQLAGVKIKIVLSKRRSVFFQTSSPRREAMDVLDMITKRLLG